MKNLFKVSFSDLLLYGYALFSELGIVLLTLIMSIQLFNWGKVDSGALSIAQNGVFAFIEAGIWLGIFILSTYIPLKLINLLSMIRKGLAFDDANILTLKKISFSLLSISALIFISSFLPFQSEVSTNVSTTDSVEVLFDFNAQNLLIYQPLLIGLILLEFIKAFKQGKELKADNDLTI